jgi:hypothetical protein
MTDPIIDTDLKLIAFLESFTVVDNIDKLSEVVMMFHELGEDLLPPSLLDKKMAILRRLEELEIQSAYEDLTK